MKKQYSVVTTVFNDSKHINRFLEDILNQTYKPSEVIIADGGSTDNTNEIITNIQSKTDIPITFLSGKRLNISEGFNLAIQNAKEELVMITAVGNRYEKHCFERLIDQFASNNIDAAYTAIEGNVVNHFSELYNRGILLGKMVMKLPSNHGTMIKKNVIQELGYFYEKFEYAGEDLELYERFKRSGKKAVCLDDVSILWDVPTTNKEYLKQIKVYMIGEMQIFDNMHILKKIAGNAKNVFLLIVSICMSLFFPRWIKICGGLIFVLWLINAVIEIKKRTLGGWVLILERKWMEVFYFLMNTKYLCSKNKITASRLLH